MRQVVIDARTATPHFPGIGRYVGGLIRALESSLPAPYRLICLTARGYPVAGSLSVEVRSSPFSLSQQWSVRRHLREIEADIYHCPYFLMPLRSGKPTVLTIYDLIPLRLPGTFPMRQRHLYRASMMMALRSADRLISISESTRDDLVDEFGISPEAITVSYPAADEAFRRHSRATVERFRRNRGLPASYVLYVGTNRPHKNLHRLVEAWSRLRADGDSAPWKLVLAGPWDSRYTEPQRLARERGIESEVIFLGPVADRDLPLLYNGAGLFVFPSLYEGFGFPVLEALACGVPVACSATSSLPEVAGRAARYFDPRQTDSITGVLRGILRDEGARADLRRRSVQQAARFSWSATARDVMAVYQSLFTRGDPGPG
jgi:glycosyltransferase involved in cell wall biosynthesis